MLLVSSAAFLLLAQTFVVGAPAALFLFVVASGFVRCADTCIFLLTPVSIVTLSCCARYLRACVLAFPDFLLSVGTFGFIWFADISIVLFYPALLLFAILFRPVFLLRVC